jgi:hypothetical protein
VIYGASVLLAVWTRNTAACVFGSIAFWILCYGVNYARYATELTGETTARPLQILVEVAYWVLPKPADLVVLLHQVLDAGRHFNLPDALAQAAFAPIASILSSLVFAIVIFLAAAYEFSNLDY